MATSQIDKYIDPKRIPGFVSMIRVMRVPNLVKEVLSVHTIEDESKKYDIGRGYVGMDDGFVFKRVGSNPRNMVRPFYYKHGERHEFKLPMTASRCMDAFTKAAVGFERGIDEAFLKALRPHMPSHNVLLGSNMYTLIGLAADAISEKEIRPARVYVKSDGNLNMALKKFTPEYEWFLPDEAFVVAADKENAGLLLTSKLEVQIKITNETVALDLDKTLGMLINPRAFAFGGIE